MAGHARSADRGHGCFGMFSPEAHRPLDAAPAAGAQRSPGIGSRSAGRAALGLSGRRPLAGLALDLRAVALPPPCRYDNERFCPQPNASPGAAALLGSVLAVQPLGVRRAEPLYGPVPEFPLLSGRPPAADRGDPRRVALDGALPPPHTGTPDRRCGHPRGRRRRMAGRRPLL